MRLLFIVSEPRLAAPDPNVVLDFVFVLARANCGLRVGIVLITHRYSYRRITRTVINKYAIRRVNENLKVLIPTSTTILVVLKPHAR